MRALLLIALAGCVGPAWATNTNKPMTMSQISARAVEAKYGAADAIWRDVGTSRTVTAAVSPAGSVVLSSVVKAPSPVVGAVIDVAVVRTVPWASVSRAVAKSLPLISTALAIKEIADAIRCREAGGGGAECDAGTAETTTTGDQWRKSSGSPDYTNGPWRTSGAAACADWQAVLAAQPSGNMCGVANSSVTVLSAPSSPGNGSCVLRIVVTSVVSSGSPNYIQSCNTSAGTYDASKPVEGGTGTSTKCPDVVVNGVTLTPVKGPDGKCATNVYAPASEDAVAAKGEAYGDKTKAPQIVGDLNAAGKPIDHPFPTVDPVPDSVVGPRETTSNPDGSTTIKDTSWDLSPTPTGYEWVPRTTTKDYPPGATIPPPGAVTDGTTTTGGAPKDEIITCGLPNTPPCKIDETGTPTTATIPKAEVDAAKDSGLSKITDLGSIQAPAWSWTFSLPTGCTAVTVGPFLSQSVVVDLCQYQSLIHDLAALIWVAFTLWACVGMAGRAFSAG